MFVDSKPIRICKNKRITGNKVFKGTANKGKSVMGCFIGLNNISSLMAKENC
nr:transposase [Flavobacterium aquiphilum]